MREAVAPVERMAERFDAWSGCLSWVPVTEQGDPDRRFGYRRHPAATPAFRAAVGVDDRAWDDPDHQLLAFSGTDSPRECATEPGEAPDLRAGSLTTAPPDPPATLPEVADALGELEEDVEDLAEPVGEFVVFNQCAYLVGITTSGPAVAHDDEGGATTGRGALSFPSGDTPPDLDLLAFPGEEPPSIECDEDAGTQDTEE